MTVGGSNLDIVGTIDRGTLLELEEVEDARIAEFCTKIESPRVLRLIAGVVDNVLLFFPESMRLPLLARLVKVLVFSAVAVACLRADGSRLSVYPWLDVLMPMLTALANRP